MFVKAAKEVADQVGTLEIAKNDDVVGAHANARDDDVQQIRLRAGKKDPVKWTELPHSKKGRKGHRDHKDHSDKDIPPDWEKRCHKQPSWCETFLRKLFKKKKEGKLFRHQKRHKLTAEEVKRVNDDCKKEKGAKKKECIKFRRFELQLWEDHGKPKMVRAAKEAQDSRNAVWMAMGALFLLLLGGVAVYFYMFGCGRGDSKGKGGLVKGTSKAGKLKSRRSKSGKSTTIKSRLGRSKIGGKSRSSKTSHRSRRTTTAAKRKRSSKNLQSKSIKK